MTSAETERRGRTWCGGLWFPWASQPDGGVHVASETTEVQFKTDVTQFAAVLARGVVVRWTEGERRAARRGRGGTCGPELETVIYGHPCGRTCAISPSNTPPQPHPRRRHPHPLCSLPQLHAGCDVPAATYATQEGREEKEGRVGATAPASPASPPRPRLASPSRSTSLPGRIYRYGAIHSIGEPPPASALLPSLLLRPPRSPGAARRPSCLSERHHAALAGPAGACPPSAPSRALEAAMQPSGVHSGRKGFCPGVLPLQLP